MRLDQSFRKCKQNEERTTTKNSKASIVHENCCANNQLQKAKHVRDWTKSSKGTNIKKRGSSPRTLKLHKHMKIVANNQLRKAKSIRDQTKTKEGTNKMKGLSLDPLKGVENSRTRH